MNYHFVYPMYAIVILTLIVSYFLLSRRIQSVKKGEIDAKRFKTLSYGDAPAYVLQAERHFINLFEVPVMFFPACLLGMWLAPSSPLALYLAWAFVGCRYIQAAVHLGPNKVYYRMTVFLVGYLVLFSLWTTLVLEVMGKKN